MPDPRLDALSVAANPTGRLMQRLAMVEAQVAALQRRRLITFTDIDADPTDTYRATGGQGWMLLGGRVIVTSAAAIREVTVDVTIDGLPMASLKGVAPSGYAGVVPVDFQTIALAEQYMTAANHVVNATPSGPNISSFTVSATVIEWPA
jgi:hypothetical protein